MKKRFTYTALAFVLSGGGMSAQVATAQGIPTYDASTVIQLYETVDQLKKQYDQLKAQYEAMTGSYGRGQIGLSESVKSSSVVPGSWQEVVAMQNSGQYGQSQSHYERMLNTMPQELFVVPEGQHTTDYQMSTDSVRAAMAGGDTLYEQVQTHLNNLAKLAQQVDSASNLKDAQDLQNRISTENGMLQSATAKLNVMNMNLQANMLNQQNQSTTALQKHFGTTD